jgi:hypothetical protein
MWEEGSNVTFIHNVYIGLVIENCIDAKVGRYLNDINLYFSSPILL